MHNIKKTFSSEVCVSWDIQLGNKDCNGLSAKPCRQVSMQKRDTDHLKIALCSTNMGFKSIMPILINGSKLILNSAK